MEKFAAYVPQNPKTYIAATVAGVVIGSIALAKSIRRDIADKRELEAHGVNAGRIKTLNP